MSDASIPGPYWIRTTTNGKHQVCGRNGATVREYMPDQIALADADCRKLQAGYTKAERAIRDAAPELFEALENLAFHADVAGVAEVSAMQRGLIAMSITRARAALAKAASQ